MEISKNMTDATNYIQIIRLKKQSKSNTVQILMYMSDSSKKNEKKKSIKTVRPKLLHFL